MTNQSKTVKLTTCGVMIALATILSLIKVYELPLGGSVTLVSMLPICLISLKYGVKWGFASSFIYALGQLGLGLGSLMTWGMDARMWFGSIAFDYIIAFGILGIAGIFRKRGASAVIHTKNDFIASVAGVVLALVLRFASHFVSGSIFFDVWMPEEFSNPYVYSIIYNGSYMLPELIVTVIVSVILLQVPATKKILLAD